MTSDAPTTPASIWCGELELSDSHTFAPDTAGHASARVLVRLHGEPMGYVNVPAAGPAPSRETVMALLDDVLSDKIAQHLLLEGTADLETVSETCPMRTMSHLSVTVVVCTRNRTQELAGCLESLGKLRYPHLDVLVVDNAPSDDSTRALVATVVERDARFRYVREPRPGLSHARNAGLSNATGEVVAYTDDDVRVDPGWVDGLVRGFETSREVGCVTGLVCAAALNTPTELYFDARVAWWSSRFDRVLFDLGVNRPVGDTLYPYAPGIFGTGANFAFRRRFLQEISGFDSALGAGSLTGGGEDLDAFVRTLLAGKALVYEPSALVWHRHRDNLPDLRRQVYAYGTGLSALLTKQLLDATTRRDIVSRMRRGLRRILDISTSTTARLDGAPPPRGLVLYEVRGFLMGPLLYLAARRSQRQYAGALAVDPR